jgi:hypothetical protein
VCVFFFFFLSFAITELSGALFGKIPDLAIFAEIDHK